MKVKGTLKFKIKENHPDKDCVVGGWDKNKVYEYEDVYTFKEPHPMENINAYIKSDLMIVAGGGYNANGIEVVDFETEVID